MHRIPEDFLRLAVLHDLACVHNRNPIRHVGHDAQIVRDKDNGKMSLLLDLIDQLQNLGLNGHVQSRGRLVADQNIRICRQCDSNHDSLPHAAGKLKRILVEPGGRFRNAHLLHKLDRLCLCNGFVHFDHNSGGLFLQIINDLNHVSAGVELLLFFKTSLIIGDEVFNDPADIVQLQLQIHHHLRLQHPVRVLALRHNTVIFCLVFQVNLFFRRILTDSVEICIQSGVQSA